MARPLDFYYDVASPYSYLAAARVEAAASKRGVAVRWKPFLLGGVFRAAGVTLPAAVPARARYMLTDLQRWAARAATPFRFSSSFPHNSLHAMRALTAVSDEQLIPASHALFRAAWVEDRNIADKAVVAAVLEEALGSDGVAAFGRIGEPEVKGALRAVTEAAVALGAFGAPSFVVGDQLYWGNDRLELALEAAAG